MIPNSPALAHPKHQLAGLMPHLFLCHGLHDDPETALALEAMSFVTMAVGLMLMKLALSISLHATLTAKVSQWALSHLGQTILQLVVRCG